MAVPASGGPSFDHMIKLLLIGDSGVGKSCLLLRFTNNSFTSSFLTTIGIDYKVRTIETDGKRLKLQIWDTAGQERFRVITTAYYHNAQGILLVYDVSDEQSFNNVRDWIRQSKEHAPSNVVKVLVGNKCDKIDKKVIDTARGQALAQEFGIKFFETSAKSNINVEKAFFEIAREISGRLDQEQQQRGAGAKGDGKIKVEKETAAAAQQGPCGKC